MDHSDLAIAYPLSAIAEAFEDLSTKVQEIKNGSSTQHIRLDSFCEIASLVSVLFRCLGLAFKFAEMEYVAKVYTSSFSFFFIILIHNHVRNVCNLTFDTFKDLNIKFLDIVMNYTKKGFIFHVT